MQAEGSQMRTLDARGWRTMDAAELSGGESRVSKTELREIFQRGRETSGVGTINKEAGLFLGNRRERKQDYSQ